MLELGYADAHFGALPASRLTVRPFDAAPAIDDLQHERVAVEGERHRAGSGDDLDAGEFDDGVASLFADDRREQTLHHVGGARAVDPADHRQAEDIVPDLDDRCSDRFTSLSGRS
jgi:hypothetical protein